MKSRSVRAVAKTVLLIAWLPILAAAQTPSPAPTNPATPAAPATAPGPAFPPYVSPEVNADHTVTFRLRAPNAQKVEVVLEGAVSPMQQGRRGIVDRYQPCTHTGNLQLSLRHRRHIVS